MPHVVVLYTGHLEREADMTGLCRALADTLIAQRDEAGQPLFPRAGTRVFAYPSAHHAVADGDDYGFVYINVRIAPGRSDAAKRRAGDALVEAARRCLAPVLVAHRVGITLQIDEAPGQVYDAKFGNLRDVVR